MICRILHKAGDQYSKLMMVKSPYYLPMGVDPSSLCFQQDPAAAPPLPPLLCLSSPLPSARPSLAVHENSQENPFFSWRFVKTAKLILLLLGGIHELPRKPTFFLAVLENSQENMLFSWRFGKTAKQLFFLCGLLLLPRKRYIPWRLNFGRQEKPWVCVEEF